MRTTSAKRMRALRARRRRAKLRLTIDLHEDDLREIALRGFRAVSRLPDNTPKTRRELYAQARKALGAHTDAKREHNALEWAIRAVEKSPKEIPGTRALPASLILSIFFLKVLWISDATSMSAYWVVRPWNKHLLPTK